MIYGLPTFPIYHGMMIGRREPEELQWLIDHGVFQSDVYRYLKIIKISDNEYRFLTCEDSRFYPEARGQEQPISGASSLQALIEMKYLDLNYWYWYGNPEAEQERENYGHCRLDTSPTHMPGTHG